MHNTNVRLADPYFLGSKLSEKNIFKHFLWYGVGMNDRSSWPMPYAEISYFLNFTRTFDLSKKNGRYMNSI